MAVPAVAYGGCADNDGVRTSRAGQRRRPLDVSCRANPLTRARATCPAASRWDRLPDSTEVVHAPVDSGDGSASGARRGRGDAPHQRGPPRIASSRAASARTLGVAEAWACSKPGSRRSAPIDIPGVSMAIVHDQDLIWSGGFGYTDLEAKIPATPDTLYSICSISKLFTSLARDAAARRGQAPARRAGRDATCPGSRSSRRTPDGPAITCAGCSRTRRGCRASRTTPTGPGPTSPSRRASRSSRACAHQETLYPAETLLPVLEPRAHARGRDRRGDVGQAVRATTSGSASSQPLGLKDTTP